MSSVSATVPPSQIVGLSLSANGGMVAETGEIRPGG